MLLLKLLYQTLAWKLPLALEIDSGRRVVRPTRVALARFFPSFRMSEGLFIASALLGVGDGVGETECFWKLIKHNITDLTILHSHY